MTDIFTQSLTAFGAGLLASLSPCVYPMIPISVGYLGSKSVDTKRTAVLLFFLGQVITFTALGMVAVKLGEVFGFSSELPALNFFIGLLFLALGIMSIFSYVPPFLAKLNNSHSGLETKFKNKFIFSFIVGVSSALLASPCTSPILGSLLASLSQARSFYEGFWLMFLYATGMSLLFLALGLGIIEARKLPRSGNWLKWVHRTSSALILGGGVYYIARGLSLW